MISVRRQKASIAFVILLHLFLLLPSATPVVQADGEEPFIGVIEDLSKDSITVRVTKVLYSRLAPGDQIRLLISKDTTIREIRGQSSKVIPFERLSIASSVWIKPNTLANQDVEASVVIVKHEPSRATRRTR